MSSNYAVLTANAGLLICVNGKKILIDALHNEKTKRFSSVSDSVSRMVISGDGDFEHIDYMIVTHDHPDHVSSLLTNNFLKNHPETHVFAPMRGLITDNMHNLMLPNETFFIDGDTFSFKKAMHDGEEYKHILNYSGIITVAGKTIAFFGDAGVTKMLAAEEISNAKVDIGIYNFPFLTLTRGREIIKKMDPEECIICHLPFEHDDINGYIPVVKRLFEKHRYNLPPMHLMEKELQKVTLEQLKIIK